MGTSLTLKAAIGVGAFDAINQTLAYVFDARIGDIVTVVQIIFIVGQFIILKKSANYRILLQIPLAAIFGQFINFFLYDVYSFFEVENYFIRLLMLIIGITWVAFFLSGVMVLDLITMPVENFSLILSNRIEQPFGKVRQWIDILCIILSLALTFIFTVDFTIREGTIIAAILFGPLLTVFMPVFERIFTQWDIIEHH